MQNSGKKGLSLRQLNAILKKWQTNLLLDDWKVSLEIVDFKRKDFRQSGDIKVYPRKKIATILLTNNPYLDEEETVVHELMHLILWDFDLFCEKIVLEKSESFKGKHGKYMNKLENTVERLTQIAINRKVQ
jgi:predicted nuclease of restriction endonuclease-like RecB superfamily